jgi:hypothetical protein
VGKPKPENPSAARPAPSGRRVEKSASAFRTISEVADELEVPQHVLRFWETKFPQVRPLKRGGGRRYYRPEDVELQRQIRRLTFHERTTIKRVQRLTRDSALKAGGGPEGDTIDLSQLGEANAGGARSRLPSARSTRCAPACWR